MKSSLADRSESRRAALCGLAVVLAVTLSPPLAALHPNHPIGFDPERISDASVEGIDHIDLFSGALSLAIPIGPFTLNYSSSVWRYKELSPELIEATPDRQNNAGLGWHLGWGEVYSPEHWYNDTNQWLYVGQDGGRHVFYSTLHRGEESVANVFYTRDNSYLRMKKLSDQAVEIELPDGTTSRFTCFRATVPGQTPVPGQNCGLGTTFRLHKTWSPFGSFSDPDTTVAYEDWDEVASTSGIHPLRWTVTDRWGRSHRVYFSGQGPSIILRVTHIEVQGFNDQIATYNFSYVVQNMDRNCKDNVSSDRRPSVPFLTQIDLPDGTNYRMRIPQKPIYLTTCFTDNDGNRVDDAPGVLQGIFLPTGGEIAWAWKKYEFPPGDTSSAFNDSAGVSTRVLVDADMSSRGVWDYKRTTVGARPNPENPDEPLHPEAYTELVYPTGDCVKHYFSALYWVDPVNSSGQPWGWERGLPFVYSAPASAGKYLSSEVYTSNDGAGSCSGTKLRSSYVRYRHDATPGTNSEPLANWYDTNRQVEATRVVYHDDGGRYIDTELSDFDGLGHFRRAVSTGNFWNKGSYERRETVIGYNRTTGTYPSNFTPPPTDEPWVLGIFDAIETYEPDARGEKTERTEYGFDRDTGFLNCERVLASGSTRRSNDLLTVRTHDNLGRVVDVLRYGSDRQPLSTAAGCDVAPAQPAYWTTYEYDGLSGALVRTRPRTSSGGYGSLHLYDADVDRWTGWVVNERDSAGFQRTYDYDAAGRIKSITPQAGARVDFDYTTRPAATETKVKSTWSDPSTGAVLNETELVFDDLGRPWKQRLRLPGGVWTEQETLTNGRGWVTSISEPGDLTKTTRVLLWDPFGRPRQIRPPDGEAHDVHIGYAGDRSHWVDTKVALAGGEANTQRSFHRDRYGQLRRTWESSAPDGGPTASTNWYDVGGRLTRTKQSAQNRYFTYDNRGFLLSERHPEKGAAGNGWVTFEDFDALGRPHGRVDGPHSLAFTYDYLGRPLDTYDRNNGSRLVKVVRWDSANGLGKGKLWYADRYNYVDLPWNPEAEESVIVRQRYVYHGIGGLASAKKTQIYWSSDNVYLTQRYAYDLLGNITGIRYPYCVAPSSCVGSDAGSGRLINQTFDQGRLTSVPGWATAVTYHPSGLWKEIRHANGVYDRQDQDDHFTTRPKRLYSVDSNGASAGFDSGLMSYDGTGNIKAMGAQTFTYDKVSRLVEASYFDGSFSQGFSYDQYGNLTGVTGYHGMYNLPVSTSTNRLVDGTYDAAGNLLNANPPVPWSYTYDTSNRVTSQAHMRYLYDADGERTVSIANIEIEAAGFHLRDLDNRLLSEIGMDRGVFSRGNDYIYAGARLLGREGRNSSVRHFHLDHLGSVRLVTRSDGSYQQEYFFYPYGENGAGMFAEDPLLFTGHERDGSTGTDYMHARHYSWSLGRFLSVDPVLGNPALPQTMNRYAYVRGNPISFADPTGLVGAEGEGALDIGYVDVIDADDTPLGLGEFLPGPGDPLSSWRYWGPNDGGPLATPDPPVVPLGPLVPLDPPSPSDPMAPPIDPDAELDDEAPHFHAPGTRCGQFNRLPYTDQADLFSAFGHALALTAESGNAIPVLITDEKTAIRTMYLYYMMRTLASRAIAKGLARSSAFWGFKTQPKGSAGPGSQPTPTLCH